MERTSEVRHEFYDGEMFAMVGASRDHNLIVTNLIGSLHPQLRDRSGEVYANDMRVQVEPTGLYTYPDLIVVCGEPRFGDERGDVLLNPTVIFEILSESTEAYDRGKKFGHYRTLGSLTDYLLVSQHEPRIEHFSRQEGGWLMEEAQGLDGVLPLPSLGCKLPLADVYERIDVA